MASRTRGYTITIFPQIDTDYPWDPQCIDWVQITPAIEHFACQLEETPSTKRLHWQCAVEFKNPVTFEAVKRCKAWRDEKGPHIERRKGTAIQARDYCLKDDSCVDDSTRFVWGMLCPAQKGREEVYRQALQAKSMREAIECVKEGAPRDYTLYRDSILRTFASEFKPPESNPCRDWEFGMAQIDQWKLKRFAIFLWGRSNTGKTSFALSHFNRPVLIRHIDDAKKITEETDGLVFDDMSFTHWPRTTCIHILDLEHESPLPTRYATTTIRAGLPRFFTSNETFDNVFNVKGTGGELLPEALRRRTKRYHVLTSLVVSKQILRFKYWDLCQRFRCTTEILLG
uniref:Replication-associated protein n=1 Tax=Emberiza chrysophrys CRESS-DNA-virus sp. TaxID=2815029 RepID=A0A8A4XCE1_9VIRU|nr:MAG: replication-associated protein [Emberiza chrysophrys CRESS-DNA-virus sp.]